MDDSRESSKKTFMFLFPAAVIAVLVLTGVWVFVSFSAEAVKYVTDLSMKRLAEYSMQDARSTRVEVIDALYMIKSAATALCQSSPYNSDESIKKIRKICADTSLKELWTGGIDGVCSNTSGTRKDFSSERYFERAKTGESFITNQVGSDNRGKFIIISAPIVRDGKVAGNVYGEYSLFRLSQILNTESFDGDGYSILITPAGDYITTSMNKNVINRNETNFWDFIRGASFAKGYSYEKFHNDVMLRNSGFAIYSLHGRTRVAYYLPVGINNWYMVKMVTLTSIMSASELLKKMVWPLVFKIVLLLLLIGAIACWYLYKFDKDRVKNAVKFQSLVDNIPGGVAQVLVTDDDFKIIYANDGFYALSGYPRDDPRSNPTYFLDEEEKETFTTNVRSEITRTNRLHAEYQIRNTKGAVRWIGVSGTVMKQTPEGVFVQAIFIDTTLNRERTEQIIERARHDKMTQLYDKVSVQEIIGRKLAGAHHSTLFVMAVLDIDNFKSINDTFGHDTGDKVIIAVANAMIKFFRDTDICGRIGGDEFAIFMINAGSKEIAEHRIRDFLAYVAGIEVADRCGIISCSIGAAVADSGEHLTYGEIFKVADECLYAAKRGGKGCSVVRLTSERTK